MTELFIVLVIRTQRPCFRSRPGTLLFAATLAVAGMTIFLPYTPLGAVFGFVRCLPRSFCCCSGSRRVTSPRASW
jgi:Mg2+-importing ATPase